MFAMNPTSQAPPQTMIDNNNTNLAGGGGGMAPAGSRLFNYMQRPPPPQMTAASPSQLTPPRVMTSMNMAYGNSMDLPSPSQAQQPITPNQIPYSAHQQHQSPILQPPPPSIANQTPNQSASYMNMTNQKPVPINQSMMSTNNSTRVVSQEYSTSANNPVNNTTQQMHNMNLAPQYHEQMGGTTYFYSNQSNNASVDGQGSSVDQFVGAGDGRGQPVMPNFYLYAAPPPHLARVRPKASALNTYFAPTEMKMDLLTRQLVTLAQPNPSLPVEYPAEVESYRSLCPLEPQMGGAERPGFFMAHLSSVYKVVHSRDGLQYCMRRIHTLVYIYDYHATAETVRTRHFQADGNLSPQKSGSGIIAPANAGAKFPTTNAVQAQSGVPESLIWSYVIQLSSALRAIHTAGLAARTMDPTKILVVAKSKLLINGAGIMDCLTYEAAQNNMPQAIQMYQSDDLYGLGRLIVALGCGSLQSAARDNLQASLNVIAHNYSTDLKNIVSYLLTPVQAGRAKAINDIMPMIGARFFTHLEAQQLRNDSLENELSKEIENGRLFRLVSKLATITERPEYGGRQSWSETGDRYLLKLFRDYVFHSVTPDGTAWIDMAHVVQSLNKLDAGVYEKIQLMSHDGKNLLIVSYNDLRRCLQQAWNELTMHTH